MEWRVASSGRSMTVVAAAIFYGVVCWGSSLSSRDKKRVGRLVKRASSVPGLGGGGGKHEDIG